MSDGVDFLVIGAQKSATTSLFHYLSAHPGIAMPPEKELDVFSDAARAARGLQHYLREYFGRCDPRCCRGEASPSYMVDPAAPARIRGVLPDVKLIAILRNPLTRALSHHRMARGRGLEPRGFLACVEALVGASRDARAAPDAERDFVALGEYGRSLAGYLEHFPRERLHVLFTEDLAADTAGEMARVFTFLGVDAGFRSPAFERRLHVSGERGQRLLRRLSRAEPLRRASRWLIPARLRRAWNYWLITEFATRPTPAPPLEEAARALLTEHFRPDVARLEAALGLRVPWPEFQREQTAPRG